jgi:hypothetical protein
LIIQVRQLTEKVASTAKTEQMLTSGGVVYDDLDWASVEYQDKATPVSFQQ